MKTQTKSRSRLFFLRMFSAGVVILALSTTGHSQQDSRDQSTSLPAGYANSNEKVPPNAFVIEANSGIALNDNVFANNANRQADALFNIGLHMGLDLETSHASLFANYLPEYYFYARNPGYDTANQNFRGGGEYALTKHLTLALEDVTAYRKGLFENVYRVPLLPGLQPGLNSTVFAPLAREFSTQTRLDVRSQISKRAALDVFGEFLLRDWGSVALLPNEKLLNTTGWTGGARYNYRLTKTVAVGASYQYQHLLFGSDSSAKFHTALASVIWQIQPTLILSAFGGPQQTHVRDFFVVAVSLPGGQGNVTISDNRSAWHPAYGGSLSKRFDHLGVTFSGQRTATDGGGLLTSVINSYEELEAQWQAKKEWSAEFGVTNGESRVLSGLFNNGAIRSQRLNIGVSHPLAANLSMQVRYEFIRQRTSEGLPVANNMDRDLITFRVLYRFFEVPMGR